jgi:hypothetical protein
MSEENQVQNENPAVELTSEQLVALVDSIMTDENAANRLVVGLFKNESFKRLMTNALFNTIKAAEEMHQLAQARQFVYEVQILEGPDLANPHGFAVKLNGDDLYLFQGHELQDDTTEIHLSQVQPEVLDAVKQAVLAVEVRPEVFFLTLTAHQKPKDADESFSAAAGDAAFQQALQQGQALQAANQEIAEMNGGGANVPETDEIQFHNQGDRFTKPEDPFADNNGGRDLDTEQ